MPEGHTLHRLAREHRRLLRGRVVAATSPQGRFASGAAALDGATLRTAEAQGKHLFHRYRSDAADLTLHVHLGLFGRFTTWQGQAPPPSTGCRLRLATVDDGPPVTIDLAGAAVCELLDPDGERRLRARLGPDPLRRGADPDAAYAALRRRRAPLGQALLDQSVIAGVGNVFRAEALFLCGLDPRREARTLTRPEFDALWTTLVGMLRDGLRRGRIVTVTAEDAGRAPGRLATEDARYVYRREGLPCRRCGTPIVAWTLAARRMYACPRCQRTAPPSGGAAAAASA